MLDLYVQYGYYQEDLISITKKGRNGQQEIADTPEQQGYAECAHHRCWTERQQPERQTAGQRRQQQQLFHELEYQ